MDFEPSESEAVLGLLVKQILTDAAAPTRLALTEAETSTGGDGIDAKAWAALIEAGALAAVAEPTPLGGPETPGVMASALMCRAHGETLAAVPLWTSLTAVLAMRLSLGAPIVDDVLRSTAAGETRITTAFAEAAGSSPARPLTVADKTSRLTGSKFAVPDAAGADWAVTAATNADGQPSLYLVALDGAGVERTRVITTDRRPAAHLALDNAPATRIGDATALATATQVAKTLVSATQAGVCARAIADTAAFIDTRKQFGRTLSSFQAPVHRLADAHIDNEAMWVTTQLAAWRLDQQHDAATAAETAKWWAADAGARIVHATQHLHGGIGADVEYPIHRTFLWAKQLGDTLGGTGSQLAALGANLCEEYRS